MWIFDQSQLRYYRIQLFRLGAIFLYNIYKVIKNTINFFYLTNDFVTVFISRQLIVCLTEFSLVTMIQDSNSIRHYQKLTDSMVDLYRRGYRFEEIRMYMDGYLSCLRQTDIVEAYHINRLGRRNFSFLTRSF